MEKLVGSMSSIRPLFVTSALTRVTKLSDLHFLLPCGRLRPLEMLISGAFHIGLSLLSSYRRAQAVTSWNEWLTYKGVSLAVLGRRGEAARQKYTRGAECHSLSLADEVDRCQMRKAKFRSSTSGGFSQRLSSGNWDYTALTLYNDIYLVIYYTWSRLVLDY